MKQKLVLNVKIMKLGENIFIYIHILTLIWLEWTKK